MLSRLFSRSVRSFSTVVAATALVAALALPVHAAPREEAFDIGPLATFVSWLEHLLLPTEKARPEATSSASPSPDRTFTTSGQCIDPNGQPVQCPDPD